LPGISKWKNLPPSWNLQGPHPPPPPPPPCTD
jgi:hypothetical protein